MEKPGPALIGSVAVHAGVVGAVVVAMLNWAPETPVSMVNAVPVSIVSDTVTVEAAPADNPSDELVEDAAAATPTPPEPTPTPPEPTPPKPQPRPVPPKAAPRPAPTPTPNRTQPTPPARQPTTPPRQPTRQPPPERTLDLDSIGGSGRPNAPRNPRPPTGDRGAGAAPRAIGQASLQALGAQVRPRFNCSLPGVDDLTIRVSVRLSDGGRVIGQPRLLPPRGGESYDVISSAVVSAIRAAQPFRMPAGYEEQDISFAINAADHC